MKITKSQKISGSVLGVCLCALVVDQLTGTRTPSVATAHATPAAMLMGLQKPNKVTSIGSNIAQCLRNLKAVQLSTFSVRDAFEPPAAFVGDDVRSAPNDRVISFQANHHLKAIIDSPGHSQAIVDDRLIQQGQWIDGFRLESVDRMRAVFNDGEVQAQLKLPGSD